MLSQLGVVRCTLGQERQEDDEYKATQGYPERRCLKFLILQLYTATPGLYTRHTYFSAIRDLSKYASAQAV